MNTYNVDVANNYGFLTAKSEDLILEIDLMYNTVTYNGMRVHLNYYNNGPDTDLLYLACALRKTIFDDANLKFKFADTLTTLRKITMSYPIPDDLKINLVKQ